MTRKITSTALISICLLLFSAGISRAQFTRIGGGLAFSTGIENDDHKTGNPALNVRGVLELGDKLWFIPELGIYMPGKRQHNTFGMATTLFGSLDANMTYKLAHEGSLLFYALGGANLSMLSTSFKSGNSTNNFMPALNVGTGIEMIIEKDINAYAQIRGVVGSYSQYVAISIGVHYYIKGRRYKTWR